MAKQTNKTNHILNLLSGNGKKKEAGDEQGLENVAPPVVPRSKTRETANHLEGTEPAESESQVIVDVIDEKVSEKENEELVNSINLALEDELKEYEEIKAAETSVAEEPPVFDEDLVTEETVTEKPEELDFDLGHGQVIDDHDDGDDFGVLFNGPSVLTRQDEPEIPLNQADELEPVEAPEAEMFESTQVVEVFDVSDMPETADMSEMPEMLETADIYEMDEMSQVLETEESSDMADMLESLEMAEVAEALEISETLESDGYNEEDVLDAVDIDQNIHMDDKDDEMIPIGGIAHGPEMDNLKEKPAEVTPEPEIKSETHETEEKLLSPDPDLDNKEHSYVTLNVMETLVDMFAMEYIEKFKICTCDRCLADVKALALTKLSGKYIVVDRDAQQAMINFYEKKFKSDITVELTKACIKIDENPHH